MNNHNILNHNILNKIGDHYAEQYHQEKLKQMYWYIYYWYDEELICNDNQSPYFIDAKSSEEAYLIIFSREINIQIFFLSHHSHNENITNFIKSCNIKLDYDDIYEYFINKDPTIIYHQLKEMYPDVDTLIIEYIGKYVNNESVNEDLLLFGKIKN